jgi:hypothetical protein
VASPLDDVLAQLGQRTQPQLSALQNLTLPGTTTGGQPQFDSADFQQRLDTALSSYTPSAPEGGGGIGGFFGGALKGLSFLPSAAVSTMKEGIDLAQDVIAGRVGRGEFSPSEWWNQATNAYGFGDLIHDERDWVGYGLVAMSPFTGGVSGVLGAGVLQDNIHLDRIIGFLGDVAVDPLTYMGGLNVITRGMAGVKKARMGLVSMRELGEQGLVKAGVAASRKQAKNMIKVLDDVVPATEKAGSMFGVSRALGKHGDDGATIAKALGFDPGLRLRMPLTGPVGRTIGKVQGKLARTLGFDEMADAVKVPEWLLKQRARNIPSYFTARLGKGNIAAGRKEFAGLMKVIRSGDQGAIRRSRDRLKKEWGAKLGREQGDLWGDEFMEMAGRAQKSAVEWKVPAVLGGRMGQAAASAGLAGSLFARVGDFPVRGVKAIPAPIRAPFRKMFDRNYDEFRHLLDTGDPQKISNGWRAQEMTRHGRGAENLLKKTAARGVETVGGVARRLGLKIRPGKGGGRLLSALEGRAILNADGTLNKASPGYRSLPQELRDLPDEDLVNLKLQMNDARTQTTSLVNDVMILDEKTGLKVDAKGRPRRWKERDILEAAEGPEYSHHPETAEKRARFGRPDEGRRRRTTGTPRAGALYERPWRAGQGVAVEPDVADQVVEAGGRVHSQLAKNDLGELVLDAQGRPTQAHYLTHENGTKIILEDPRVSGIPVDEQVNTVTQRIFGEDWIETDWFARQDSWMRSLGPDVRVRVLTGRLRQAGLQDNLGRPEDEIVAGIRNSPPDDIGGGVPGGRPAGGPAPGGVGVSDDVLQQEWITGNVIIDEAFESSGGPVGRAVAAPARAARQTTRPGAAKPTDPWDVLDKPPKRPLRGEGGPSYTRAEDVAGAARRGAGRAGRKGTAAAAETVTTPAAPAVPLAEWRKGLENTLDQRLQVQAMKTRLQQIGDRFQELTPSPAQVADEAYKVPDEVGELIGEATEIGAALRKVLGEVETAAEPMNRMSMAAIFDTGIDDTTQAAFNGLDTFYRNMVSEIEDGARLIGDEMFPLVNQAARDVNAGDRTVQWLRKMGDLDATTNQKPINDWIDRINEIVEFDEVVGHDVFSAGVPSEQRIAQMAADTQTRFDAALNDLNLRAAVSQPEILAAGESAGARRAATTVADEITDEVARFEAARPLLQSGQQSQNRARNLQRQINKMFQQADEATSPQELSGIQLLQAEKETLLLTAQDDFRVAAEIAGFAPESIERGGINPAKVVSKIFDLKGDNKRKMAQQLIRDGLGSGPPGSPAPLMGGAEFGPEMSAVIEAYARVNDPKEWGRFWNGWDKTQTYLKAAMIATPGFVNRNIFGAFFNAWLDGVNPAEIFRAVRMSKRVWAEASQNNIPALDAAKRLARNDDSFKDYVELLERGVRGGGQAVRSVELQRSLGGLRSLTLIFGPKTGRQRQLVMAPWSPKFVPYKAVRDVNGWVEDMIRLGVGMDTMKRGGNLDDALNRIAKSQFDYGEMTAFEETWMRRFIPFYTWTRKNVPYQLQQLGMHPYKYNRILAAKRNLELGTEEEGTVPDYYLEPFGIRMPFSRKGATIYSVPDLPFQDLFRYDPLRGGLREGVKDTVKNLGWQVTPMIKTPIEMMSKTRFASGIPFSGRYQQVPPAIEKMGFLLPILEQTGWAKRTPTGEWKMRDHHIYGVGNMLPTIGLLRRVWPNEERYQRRQLTSLFSVLGGMSVQFNSPDAQYDWALSQHYDRLREQRELRDLLGREV